MFWPFLACRLEKPMAPHLFSLSGAPLTAGMAINCLAEDRRASGADR